MDSIIMNHSEPSSEFGVSRRSSFTKKATEAEMTMCSKQVEETLKCDSVFEDEIIKVEEGQQSGGCDNDDAVQEKEATSKKTFTIKMLMIPVLATLAILGSVLFVGRNNINQRPASAYGHPVDAAALTHDRELQTASDVQQWGRRSCELVNSIRAQYGMPQLHYSGTLTDRAFDHSIWMATYNSFTHQNLAGVWFFVYDTARANTKHTMQATGENLKQLSNPSTDVAIDFHWAWVYSPTEFQNMLSGAHTHCGAGFTDFGGGQWWGTQLFGSGPFGNEAGGQTPA